MKAIMVMFDSLNRHMLPPYGCDWTHAPNFQRLAQRCATFDSNFVGSMPCMPARREIHTGRYNFLHRSWGPLEPFDDSMPRMLNHHGVHTHLVSDHYHYWEEGGANYHTKYGTWEISRGQEGDIWKAEVAGKVQPPEMLPNDRERCRLRQDWINRQYCKEEKDFPQGKTFALAEEFLRVNHAADSWFLTVETFDPHEPFFAHEKYRELYDDDWDGPLFDWPNYGRVKEPPEAVRAMRLKYAALLSQCDAHLGRILDLMDELDLWSDTMLIVNTDHGFLLSEHDYWGKVIMPFYNEVAWSPLFIWDPRSGVAGQRRQSLVQTIDLAPTLLEYFGVDRTPDMQGTPLRDTIAHDTPVREAGLFGVHGGQINVTDGRYVYMRSPTDPANTPLYNYTLMPAHMLNAFSVDTELDDLELAEPFTFTKGCRTLRSPASRWGGRLEDPTVLYDNQRDPAQQHPIDDPELEQRMIRLMVRAMIDNDAPPEQFERMDLLDHVPAR